MCSVNLSNGVSSVAGAVSLLAGITVTTTSWSSGPMPPGRDEQAAEAMRRALPDLRKLDRYERQAFKAKHHALRKLAELVKF